MMIPIEEIKDEEIRRGYRYYLAAYGNYEGENE